MTTLRGWQGLATTMFVMEDSDPALVAITRSGVGRAQMLRMGVAWLTYYNLGVAAVASELTESAFWNFLRAQMPHAKRGTDRRYMRGKQAVAALDDWSTRYPRPEQMLDQFMVHAVFGPIPYDVIRKAFKGHVQIGPYFMWKYAELVDTLIQAVDMTGSEQYSARDPQKGAALIMPGVAIAKVYAHIIAHAKARGVTAPPNHKRPFGILEAETVCCVYAHTYSEGYQLGARTAKTLASIRTMRSLTATRMEQGVLRLSPWNAAELEALL